MVLMGFCNLFKFLLKGNSPSVIYGIYQKLKGAAASCLQLPLCISGVVTQHTVLSGAMQGHVCSLCDRAVVLLHCMSALEDPP